MSPKVWGLSSASGSLSPPRFTPSAGLPPGRLRSRAPLRRLAASPGNRGAEWDRNLPGLGLGCDGLSGTRRALVSPGDREVLIGGQT